MTDTSGGLPSPRPRILVTDDEALSMIKGMDPGNYSTADIYPRYEIWARREGKAIATRQALGIALQKITERVGRAHGNASVWVLTPEMVGQRDGRAQMSAGQLR